MRRAFTFVSKSFAILFSVAFTAAMVVVLLLETTQYALLTPRVFRPLMEDHQVYARLPALMAEQSALLLRSVGDSCENTPLVCALDGGFAELQACLRNSLGEAAYAEIQSHGREPTDAELQSSQPCLDQYGDSGRTQPEPNPGSPEANPLLDASAGVQACAREALGNDIYEALYTGQRASTQRETRKINACIREERRNERLNHPGIGGDLTPILNGFSAEQWEGLFRLLLPAEDLRRMTEATLAEASTYLDGETDTLSVSLASLKNRLAGESGEELILFLLAAQPPCTEEQQARILGGDFENGGNPAIYCAASGETLNVMVPAMRSRLERVASQIPDEAVLISPASTINIPRPGIPFGDDRPVAIRQIRDWMRLSPLIPMSLLLLVTLFAVRSVRGWLRWWAIPLLSAGLIALAIGLAAQPLLDWIWAHSASQTTSPVFSSGLGKLGHEILYALAGELGKWMVIEAALMILLGSVGIMHSNHLPQTRSKRKEDKRAFTAPEISEAEEAQASEMIHPRSRDDTGYS